jgi:hypothetical protein
VLILVVAKEPINQILEVNINDTGEHELGTCLALTQQVLSWVAQYSQPVGDIEQVCNHQGDIANQQNLIMMLRAQTPPTPLICDHPNYKIHVPSIQNPLEVG